MRVAYFAHELGDPAVRRRVRMLEAGGCNIDLLGFERARFESKAGARHYVLGRTESGRLIARIGAVARAIPRAWSLREIWRGADLIIARNLEMLAIAALLTRFVARKPRLAYECLDIHRLMIGRSPANIALRAMERLCLAAADMVITSSPAFVHTHFRARQGFKRDIVLMENKVLELDTPPPNLHAPAAAPPWTIAWCGVLRCARSFALLRCLADTLGPAVRIELWGAPAEDQIPDFHARLAGVSNMHFGGRYAAEDLRGIYARAHFAWCLDFYEAGGNSDWLLPNRLYEGLRHGAIPIALDSVETAHWLKARGVGIVLEEPLEHALATFIAHMSAAKFSALREAVAALPPETTAASREDCRALVARLMGTP